MCPVQGGSTSFRGDGIRKVFRDVFINSDAKKINAQYANLNLQTRKISL